jgi:hypothetical protein
MFHWMHREIVCGLDLQNRSETVAAQRLPGWLGGWDESERHGVLRAVELRAAPAANFRELLHPLKVRTSVR